MTDLVPTGDGDIDVDHHAPAFIAERHRRYAELRSSCPVAWNRHYGGFWLVTDYESVAAVARDNETFAHRYETETVDDISYHGICGIPRPAGVPRQGVSETDGPEHADLRRLLHPFFTPKRVEELAPRMRAVAASFVDSFIERGEADLVLDYTTPVPAVLTLEMMGMPSENWQHYADFFHAMSSYEVGAPEYLAAVGNWQAMMTELLDFAGHRRDHPADDITSALVAGELEGRPLSDDDVGAIMWNLVAGGLDTTTSLVSWGLYHLGTHPDERAELVRERDRLPSAIEEYLRYYSPSETLTRTVTRDVELAGRQLRPGDVVMISWVAANRDPAAFADPEQIVLDRLPNKHLAFGLGGHRCIGSHVARTEAAVMFDEILDRIPDYTLDLDRFRPYPGNVLMTGVVSMPATL